MGRQIPNSVIGATASVIGQHYYSHSKLDTLFMESGAPGEPPAGNCESKCASWLRRCNEDETVDALDVLGEVIQHFMELEPYNGNVEKGQQRIRDALAKTAFHTRRTAALHLPVVRRLRLDWGTCSSVAISHLWSASLNAHISNWSAIHMPPLRRRVRSSKPFAGRTSRRLRWNCPRK